MKSAGIFSLDSDSALSRRSVGNQAAALAKLYQLGFPVLDSFCLQYIAGRSRRETASLIESAIGACAPAERFLISPSPATREEADSDLTGFETDAEGVTEAVLSFFNPALPDGRTPPAAVLVQRPVHAALSGIAFTADPITGSRTVALEIHTTECVSSNSSARLTAAPNGKIKRLGVDCAKPFVTDENVQRLVDLCRRAETALTWPCEIEWAMEGETIRIIRVRPLQATARTNPEDLWTRANIGEVVPERMTPLSYSAWQRPMELLFRCSFRHFHLPFERFQFIRNESGKLWYNVGALNYLTGLLGLPAVDLAIGSVAAESRAPRRLRPWRILRHAIGLAKASFVHARLPRSVAAASLKLQNIARKYTSHSEGLTADSCLDLARRCYAELEPMIKAYADATSASFGVISLLDLAASRWLPAGFSFVPLLSSKGVVIADAAEVLEALRQDPDNSELAEQFMKRFGHRGWQEVEFMSLTWRELGSLLWRTRAAPRTQQRADGSHTRSAAGSFELPASLAGWRRHVISGLVEQANVQAVLRENIKHEFTRPIDAIRRLLRTAARILATEKLLETERDLYFLTLGELDLLVSQKGFADLRGRAALLRELWEADEDTQTNSPSPAVPAHANRRWQGFGVSSGRVSGWARILRSPAEMGRVRPGDILVADVLDAGWFPLFSVVAGIVTSLGGMLSHPSIVARECGIPAVVGIAEIPRSIQDGSWISIDGDSGTVETIIPAETHSMTGASA
jgi:pyruvate,water dikinase